MPPHTCVLYPEGAATLWAESQNKFLVLFSVVRWAKIYPVIWSECLRGPQRWVVLYIGERRELENSRFLDTVLKDVVREPGSSHQDACVVVFKE